MNKFTSLSHVLLFMLISLLFANNTNAQNYTLSEGTEVGINGYIINIEFVDLNQDGKLDQLVQNVDGKTWLSYGLRGGIFAAPTLIINIGRPVDDTMVINDVNEDGLPDIVFQIDRNLYWIENKKNYFLAPQVLCADCVVGYSSKTWDMIDMNDDQKADIISLSYNEANQTIELYVAYNLGGIAFSNFTTTGIVVDNRGSIKDINTKDIDQNGVKELFLLFNNEDFYYYRKNETIGVWEKQMMQLADAFEFIDTDGNGIYEIMVIYSTVVSSYNYHGELVITSMLNIDCDEHTWDEIVIADINGDKQQDITFGDFGCKIITCLRDGNTFTNPIQLIDVYTRKFEIADIDGDQDQDIVLAAEEIKYYKNNGTAQFAFFETNSFDIIALNIDNISRTDLNNDRQQDFVIKKNNSFVFKLLQPNGKPGKTYIKQFGEEIDSYSFADIDQDGDNDILIARNDSLKLSRNQGNMVFGEWEHLINNDVYFEIIGVGDLNNDSRMDIVLAHDNTIHIYYQLSIGDLAFELVKTLENSGKLSRIDIVDIDKDGINDLLLSYFPMPLRWLKNSEQGIDSTIQPIPYLRNTWTEVVFPTDSMADEMLFAIMWDVQIIAVERQNDAFKSHVLVENDVRIRDFLWIDMNHDDKKDLVFIDIDGTIKGSLAQADGSFMSPTIWMKKPFNAISLYDITIEGQDVLLIHDVNVHNLWLHTLETYEAPMQENIITNSAENLTDFCTADLDQDGWTDIITVSQTDNTIIWYRNQQNDTFSEARITHTESHKLQTLAPIDIDQDGDIDIATASADDNTIAYYLNDGQGNLSPASFISQQVTGASNLAAGDIDGDGKIDLISIGTTGKVVYWHKNLGDGNFDNRLIVADTLRPIGIFVADPDKDGLMDIIVSSETQSVVHFGEYKTDYSQIRFTNIASIGQPQTIALINAGNCFIEDIVVLNEQTGVTSCLFDGFRLPRPILSNLTNAKAMCTADIDQDGRKDIVVGSYNTGEILWQRCFSAFGFNDTITISKNALGIKVLTAADLDNDGDDDIVAASVLDGKIRWFKNQSQKHEPLLPPDNADSPIASFYPNPTPQNIYIQFHETALFSQYHCQLYTISGQLVDTKDFTNTYSYSWSLENLPAGLYFLRITHNDQSQVFRIVKR
ncbi:MAG: T9SS type A sorting domain-containing protein [Chitinophagales bacterium]|nr:T9SS type A sorting domain-containing protein [Chitinophagales bacterium]